MNVHLRRFAVYLLPVITILITSLSASATTVYSLVDFSSQANFSWRLSSTDPGGQTGVYFPNGPIGAVTLGGIPFNITSNASGFQAWNAYRAANGGSGTVSITIPMSVYGVTDVYTLINSYWQAAGPYAALVFTGSNGASHTVQLTGGVEIRNWCCTVPFTGTFTTTVHTEPNSPINGAVGYLDMQHIVLPSAFATQMLVSIQLIDSGAPFLQRTILDGVTVASVSHYNVCLLYDATKAVRSGSTQPIKLQLCDGTGNNLSSASLNLHAINVTKTSDNVSGDVEDAGNANPDDDFRFDATLGGTGGYIFNLKTTGLTTGTYRLNFTVAGDALIYSAPFQVR